MTNCFRTRIRTLLFTSHGLYTTPIYIQRSLSFFSTAHLWFIQKFLYIHLLLTHTRIPLYVFYIKTLLCTFSFFFIYADILFTTLLSFFIMILVRFIFRTTLLKTEKNSTRFRNFYKHYPHPQPPQTFNSLSSQFCIPPWDSVLYLSQNCWMTCQLSTWPVVPLGPQGFSVLTQCFYDLTLLPA